MPVINRVLPRGERGMVNWLAEAAAGLRAWLPAWLMLAVFALLRLPYLASVEPDDADLILFSQQLAWGYSEQPPLYSWLCEPFFRLLGRGATALLAVQVGILAGILLLFHAVARMAIADARLAGLATAAVLLIPSLTWHALTYLTHSNLLFLTGLLTLHAALRVVRDGSRGSYLLLGVACAAGMLSKYNFAVFALALVLAAWSLPIARARLFHPRILLTVAVAALLIAPHAVWIWDQQATLRLMLEMKLSRPRDSSLPGRLAALRGFAELIMNVLAASTLLLLATRWLAAGHDAVKSEGFHRIARLLILRFLAMSLAILTVQVFAYGADRFHERWLMPFALVLPVWLFARLDSAVIPAARWRVFLILLALAAGCYTAARALQVSLFLDRSTSLYPLRLDFGPLAARIKQQAGEQVTIITAEREIGGNLLLHLPHARVRCARQPLFDPGPASGPVVLAWNLAYTHGQLQPPWELFRRYHIQPRPVPPEAVHVVPVSRGSPPSRVAFVVLTP